jgi:hypothetical protein
MPKRQQEADFMSGELRIGYWKAHILCIVGRTPMMSHQLSTRAEANIVLEAESIMDGSK